MAEGNWSVVRVEKISAEGAQKTERHNERKNESYANLNVDTEQIARNIHFKDTGGLTYNEYFQRLIDEGKISTRGQKAGATIFNELVIDVNTRYFEEHGGYEYARQFYEEAYRFGCEIYGEENIVSAVMHADEINKAVSVELGKPVYHYHLHIVAIPTVRKEILWSKRCKDEALRGTVKEVINQVSHSKKWKNTVPLLDENGQQVISKYGKPMFRKSYSVLQDKLFAHMTEAGFSGFERGILGSTAENLSSLDYQIQKDKERLADIQERIEAEQVRYEPAHEVRKTIAAGGGVAVMSAILICLIGLIVASSFGIFFSSEDTGSEMTMRQAVQEINTEYQNKIDVLKANHPHDKLEMKGSRAVWPEVLSVYAVKLTTDADNPQEVATVTPEKKRMLEDIFWAMNKISSKTELKQETEITEKDDGHGHIVEESVQKSNRYLYIESAHKTADEMAAYYRFTDDQKQQMSELLAQDSKMWSAVLYGIYGSDDDIVSVALSQIGNVGGEPYWSWYGFNSRVEWCACFVSWCADQCGYIEAGICPKYAGCSNGVQWFKERAQWLDNTAEPAPGMVIFFDWDNKGGSGPKDGAPDHTGIVEKVENGMVYTVEGNSGDVCRERVYPLGYYEILGYGGLLL